MTRPTRDVSTEREQALTEYEEWRKTTTTGKKMVVPPPTPEQLHRLKQVMGPSVQTVDELAELLARKTEPPSPKTSKDDGESGEDAPPST